MRIGDYVIGCQGNDETAQCGKCGSDMEPVRPGKWQCPKCELEEMIQQAHRQGWEQAKAEARVLSFSCSCGKAITGMEYKGAENDR